MAREAWAGFRSDLVKSVAYLSIALVVLCLCVVPAGANEELQDEGGLKLAYFESEHYRLGTNIDEATSKEYSQVLEAMWPLLVEYFDDEPKLRKNERLTVYFLDSRESWRAKLNEDGVAIPVGAGGYYWPGNKCVYLFRQPTLYNSRQLLIHEAMHQFHFLAKCNNTGPKDEWYTEGLVEYLSRHYWDGEKLTLGVVPFCSLADYPKKALDLFDMADYDFAGMITSERASARPEQWALVRYLITEGDKKKWAGLAKKLDGGQDARNNFKKYFGEADKLKPKVHEWLKTQQEPFIPVWNEWQGRGPDACMGTAPTSYSMCRTRADADSIAADVLIPKEGNWQGGVLVYFDSTDDYAMFMINQSGDWLVTRGGKSWSTSASGKVETPKSEGSYRLKAVREGDSIKLHIDNAEVGAVELPKSPMGICLRNCTLEFRKIEWK